MTSAVSAGARDHAGGVVSGKYRLDSLIGEGGMGSVWRAFNLQLEVPVALKLLRDDLNTTELRERLRVEARAAAKLVHPSIVRVFDIGETEAGSPYIVMELLHGETLGALFDRGALPAARAVQLLLPVAEALCLAHSRGLVHRDVKPDNIFIAQAGGVFQPKLLDFGIAKVTGGVRTLDTSHTLAGTLVGSPEYMSPEQARCRPDIDQRSDVWAFCVVLYEGLAGRRPFSGDTYPAVLASVIVDAPPPLPNVDPALMSLVLRGLAKDRDARPASVFELGQLLAAWLLQQGTTVDVTGSSLKTKWLEHLGEQAADPAWNRAPSAERGHSTLISVVHTAPPPSSELSTFARPAARRWWPGALVASSVLLAAASWALVHAGWGLEAAASSSEGISVGLVASVPPEPTAPSPVLAAEATQPPAPAAPAPNVQSPSAAPSAAPRKVPARFSPLRARSRAQRSDLVEPYDPGI